MANPFLRGWGFADQMMNTANQRQLGMLGGAINFQNAQMQNAIREQGLSQDQAFRQGMGALGPNPDLQQAAFLAAQHGKPEIAAALFTSAEGRKAREAMATQAQTAAQEAIRIREQERRQSREEADARARQSKEELLGIAASLRPPKTDASQKAPPGYRFSADGETLEPIPGGPKAQRSLTATERKEVFDAENKVLGGTQAVDYLGQALKINEKAMGFPGAGALATAGSILPENMRPATVDATLEYDNLVQNSALPQLKSIFGGNPTEGERKMLLEVAGSSSKPPAVRKGILERAMKAAQERITLNEGRAEGIRSGEFFEPRGGRGTERRGGIPQGVDEKIWNAMTEQERALWRTPASQ